MDMGLAYHVGEGEGVWSLHLCAIAISDQGLRYIILIWIAIKGNICGNPEFSGKMAILR